MAKYTTTTDIKELWGVLQLSDGSIIELNGEVPSIDFDPDMIQHWGELELGKDAHILVVYDDYYPDVFDSLLEIQALFHSLKVYQNR